MRSTTTKTEVMASLAVASSEEKAGLSRLTAPERAWYEGWHRFATNIDIVNAVKDGGKLVPVSSDSNVRLIGRLRNPDRQQDFPPFLLRHSALALKAVGLQWRFEMDKAGLDPHAQLAVTSLVRSEEMQAAIVNDPAKLAEPDSTHVVGASFDIDASAYYTQVGGQTVSVISPKRSMVGIGDISNVLRDKSGTHTYDIPKSSRMYDEAIIGSLLKAVDFMHSEGLINRILEYAGTGNQCVHICPNPEIKWEGLEPRTW